MSLTAQEYAAHDAVGLAELLADGQVSAAELEATARSAIDALNPLLNAVVADVQERAPASGGRFGGVPYLVKDLVATVAGASQTEGSAATGENVAETDSLVIARSRSAGLVPVGRTSTSELGILSTAESARFGPTLNPWNPGLSTGGSSGGSAAAVAAGIVPVAYGNDVGGSLRIPASCCGAVGFKPSRGAVPNVPFGQPYGGMVAEFFITRSVRDQQALYDAISGAVPGDSIQPSPAHQLPDRPRVGMSMRPPQGGDTSQECIAAVRRTADMLASIGYEVEESDPPFDQALADAYYTIWTSAHVWFVDTLGRRRGRPIADDELEPSTRHYLVAGRTFTAADLHHALETTAIRSREFAEWTAEHDIWLTPTVADSHVPIGHFTSSSDGQPLRDTQLAPFTWPLNAVGAPAISLPLETTSSGLPIGIQLAARPGADRALLRFAATLEEHRPWTQRRPPIWVANT